jgi:hypothetical protein
LKRFLNIRNISLSINKKVIPMDNRAQSALEYLMTYGWALVVIAIIIGVLVVLLGSSTTVNNCTISPAGGFGYVDHAVNVDGNLSIRFRNETGKTVTGVAFNFDNDFSGATDLNGYGPYVSAEEFTINAPGTGITSEESYNGKITITYNRGEISHSAVANCTGRAS